MKFKIGKRLKSFSSQMKSKRTFLHLLHVILFGTPRTQKFFCNNPKKNRKKKWKGIRAEKINEGPSKKWMQ